MADPFGFIGDTLQSAFLPDTEDEEARKYREEYERMRRTLRAQGKPAPPPIYQTRKPKNLFGGLLPEYGAGTLAKKRRAERDLWRRSYDPVAMKRFQDQRKRDEQLRDITERQRLEKIGGKAGQTPSMTPAFTKALTEGGWSPAEQRVFAKRGDSAYRARTDPEEARYEQLYGMHAPDISKIEAAQQARARTPGVESEQRYVKNYWDTMNRGKVWESAVDKQESQNKFTKAYNDIKLDFEQETASDKRLLSKVAGLYADLKRKSYEQSPQAHIDALTKTASMTATKAGEYTSPGQTAERAALSEARRAAAQKSVLESGDFIDWFNRQDPKDFPPGFVSEQEWRKVEAMIRAYAARSSGLSDTEFRAAMEALLIAAGLGGGNSAGGGAGGSWRPASTVVLPPNIPLDPNP